MSPKTGAARTARTRGGPAVAPVALIELSTALRSWGAKRPSASEVGDWRPVFSGRPTPLTPLFRTSFCLGLCLGCDQGPTPFSPGASEFRRYLFLPGLCTIDARICAIVQHITPLEHSTFQLLSFPPIAVRLSPARLLLVAACPAAAQLRSLKPRHRASPVYGTNEEATYRQARCAASPPGWDA